MAKISYKGREKILYDKITNYLYTVCQVIVLTKWIIHINNFVIENI